MKKIEEYRQEVRDDFGQDIDEIVLVDALAICRQMRDREKEHWVCILCDEGVVSYHHVTNTRLKYICNNCDAEFTGRTY